MKKHLGLRLIWICISCQLPLSREIADHRRWILGSKIALANRFSLRLMLILNHKYDLDIIIFDTDRTDNDN